MTERYPLTWPPGWPRTQHPRRAIFKTTQEKAQRDLVREIQLLGGRNWIISTNIPIRKDGMPYADADRRGIRDNGVAVYFDLHEKQKCFACDRWDTIKDNMQGIMKTIEALRGIDRWGSGRMVEAAFRGFDALPPPSTYLVPSWWDILQCDRNAADHVVKSQFKILAMEFHPDMQGGSSAKMAALNLAMDSYRKERNHA